MRVLLIGSACAVSRPANPVIEVRISSGSSDAGLSRSTNRSSVLISRSPLDPVALTDPLVPSARGTAVKSAAGSECAEGAARRFAGAHAHGRFAYDVDRFGG